MPAHTGSRGRGWLIAAIVLSAVMLALLVRLGLWQLERAEFKEDLAEIAEQNDARTMQLPHEIVGDAETGSWHFRKTQVEGRFDAERQYLLDNRTFDGRAGYQVLSVFEYQGRRLLVNRGWVAVGDDRRQLPDVKISDAPMQLAGRLSALPAGGLLLGESGYTQSGWPKVVQRVELDTMQAQLGYRLLPAMLLLDPQSAVCLACRWEASKGVSAQRHRGYAVQWFALAVALVVLLIVATIAGRRRRAG